MYTSTYPTRFKQLASAGLAILLLTACATSPLPTSSPASGASGTPTVIPLPAEPAPPSIIIQGRPARSILDSIVKYRTQKGMRLVQRDSSRVVLNMAVPKSNPPAEAQMIFSLAPAPEAPAGLRLSAQVFQIIKQGGKIQNTEITASLRENLEEELDMYAR